MPPIAAGHVLTTTPLGRRIDKLVESPGTTSLSKSQVSVMAKEFDTAVETFRTRPLDASGVICRTTRRG